MARGADEDRELRSVALKNAESISLTRQRAERELLAAKEALEARTEELANSLAMVRATLESTFDGILVTDVGGKVTGSNEKYIEMWAIPRELTDEGEHRRVLEIASNQVADPRGFIARVEEISASAPIESFDVLELKDGRVVERYSRIQVVDSRNVGRVWSFRDVTQRRRAEAALRDETRILELLNNTGAAIAAQLDLQMLLQTVTDAATLVSGAKFGAFFYNTTDSNGDSFLLYALSGAPREAFAGFGQPRATPLFAPTFRAEAPVRIDDVLRDPRYGQMAPHHGMPKGHLPVRSYLAVPVKSRSGEVFGGLFFGHPEPGVFTERVERVLVGIASQAAVALDNARLYDAAQKEIASREAAQDALREADRRKDEFLATLAHELRNPLAPILHAALISKGPATDEQKAWSQDVILRQVQHMSLLLDDLLDISRITRGSLEIRKTAADLAFVMATAVETARPVIDAKGHVLTVELPAEPLEFWADPMRIAQVLSNLLTNAAKYTDPGGRIRLSATRSQQTIVITVTDNGIGIAPEAMPNIFVMFSQVRSATDRSDGGLGIGLALAKSIADLHGGTIEARSNGLGAGSEFTVRLPVGVAPHAVADGRREQAPPDSQIVRKVLIADDNRDVVESLAQLLRMEGHEVEIARNGEEALARFAAFRPDVALLDIGMPNLNGYEVARKARALSPPFAVTLIAVTGWGQEDDKARAKEAGFDHHFTKPLDFQQLRALLRT